ncbi:hypothetical protein NPIL_141361 [Nephila pilipes]|uniref:Uncharacterized protein n=1 Tax=Nephila pilipes TaxID=299642 RepID=A0A8X6NVM7_NEPPI|nr:hypothetical protein NPIL_141361 [Nephila pilipes]
MSPPVLACYTDADWTELYRTLFECESEYIAAAEAAQEIQWLILLLKVLRLEQHQPIKRSRITSLHHSYTNSKK